MSIPPDASSQPSGEPDWVANEPPAAAPADDAYTADNSPLDEGVPGERAANEYAPDDAAQPNYTQNDYIRDDTWEGAAVPPGHASHPYSLTPPPRSRDRLRFQSSLVQGMLVVLALLVIVALAATVAVFTPESLTGLLPAAREEAAPAAVVINDPNAEATDAAPDNSATDNDVFIMPNRTSAEDEATPGEATAPAADNAEDNAEDNAVDAPEDDAAESTPGDADQANGDGAGEAASAAPPTETPVSVASTPGAAQLFVQAVAASDNEQWLQAAQFYERVRALDVGYQPQRVAENLLVAYNNAAAQLLAGEAIDTSSVEAALQLSRSALALDGSNESAQAQSERLNNFVVGNRALRLGDPATAIERLQPFAQEADGPLSQLATARLYDAHLLLGDEAMRAAAIEIAVANFNAAAALAVADSSALAARLDSLNRLDFIETAELNAAAQSLLSLPLTSGNAEADNTDSAEADSAEADVAAPAAPVAVAPAPVNVPPLPTPAPIAVPPTPAASDALSATEALTATEVAIVAAPTAPPVSPACAGTSVSIVRPQPNAVVSGLLTVTGSATNESFEFYKLEFTPVDRANVAWFAGGERPVISGPLGSWDTTAQPNGDYIIRLTVVDDFGNYPPPCDVPVRVQN